MKINIGIIYLSHDGYSSLYTGVGVLARDYLVTFPKVRQSLMEIFPDCDFSFHAVTGTYNSKCFGYSQKIQRYTLDIAEKYYFIKYTELLNGSNGEISYGSEENWKYASLSAATYISEQLKYYNHLIVLASDTPYAWTGLFLLKPIQHKNLTVIWIPQSTVKIHKVDGARDDGTSKQYEQTRFKYEQAVIQFSKKDSRQKIGYIGDFMKNHLIEEYQVNESILFHTPNSINFIKLNEDITDQNTIKTHLKSLGIPIDKKLIFGFGRGEEYKGLHLILENAEALIQKNPHYFVVILCSPWSMKDSYVQKLKELERKLYPNAKVIFGLDFITPHLMFQWKNTFILALLSSAEPFGLIPIECRYYNNPNLTLLVSDGTGLADQVVDGKNGFITTLDNKTISEKLDYIANLTPTKKKVISSNGKEYVESFYNQEIVNTKMFQNICDHFVF